MTLVSLPSPIPFPGNVGIPSSTFSLNNLVTVSAAGHFASWVFCAREDMVVSHIGFRAGTSTGSPTCTVGIETVDASGIPSGSAGFGSTNGTTATISSNTWVLTALGASATIPKGTMFAVKVAYNAGTSQVIQGLGNFVANYNIPNIPYTVINAGSNTKAAPTSAMLVACGSSSTDFYQLFGAVPYASTGGGGFNNTNSAKRGLLFTPPMNCRAVGARWWAATAVGDYTAGMYTGDAAGTELSSSTTAFEGDQSGAGVTGIHTVYFDNPVTLTAGTPYRVAIEPTSATNNNVTTITVVSSNYMTATPGGQSQQYTSLASGTWTDSNTQYPLMDVLIDQVDDGTGSGGSGVVGVIGG